MSAVVCKMYTRFLLQHEDASVQMFDHMVRSNGLWREFKMYNFEDKDLVFVKEQIAGPQECAGNKVGFVAFDVIN